MAKVSELNELSQRLTNLRIQKGYSQKQLSEILHVGTSIISAYETGVRTPSLSVIIKYAQIFHVTTDYILGTSKNDSAIVDTAGLTSHQVQAIIQLIETMKHE